MDEVLRKFNGDPHTKDAFKAYMLSYIEAEAVKRVFNREDVSSVADAYELMNKVFEQLGIDYGIPDKYTPPTNEAK